MINLPNLAFYACWCEQFPVIGFEIHNLQRNLGLYCDWKSSIQVPGGGRISINYGKQKSHSLKWLFSDPAGARTQDPNIKSVVLYQLSYGIDWAF